MDSRPQVSAGGAGRCKVHIHPSGCVLQRAYSNALGSVGRCVCLSEGWQTDRRVAYHRRLSNCGSRERLPLAIGGDGVVSTVTRATFRGGIHPRDYKELTKDRSILLLDPPEEVCIPLLQHLGAPCSSLVKRGERVLKGQKIGESDQRLSAPVHSSVAGKVKRVDEVELPGGIRAEAVLIENDGSEESAYEAGQVGDPFSMSPEEVTAEIRESGVVGMGGATFPTHFKLNVPDRDRIHSAIVNGVECEPYLTADHRLMLEETESVVHGIQVVMHVLQVKVAYLGIESNKPDAISAMERATALISGITVVPLEVKYPQGAEKQLIQAILKKEVPPGGLPMDVGTVVTNVGTCSAISRVFTSGAPLMERVATVSGSVISSPSNVRGRIGTSLQSLVDSCGGLSAPLGKLVIGGPMMGIAHHSLDTPLTKGMSGVLCFSESESRTHAETACLRCGRCLRACPMGLMPGVLADISESGDIDALSASRVKDCMECGSCAFVCPAQKSVVQSIRLGKRRLAAAERKRRQS